MERTRREFIAAGVGGVAAVAVGGAVWRGVFDSGSDAQSLPDFGYGPRGVPDANGIRLPEGFSARIVARGNQVVEGTGYRWHEASDGMATFPLADGGWILVSNSEAWEGGASAIRFSSSGSVVDAYRILEGTRQNCSGGGTPWGTWLSCEEFPGGYVWECDPSGHNPASKRPSMGKFMHESAAVDPAGKRIYMTEDVPDGGFYRFTPNNWTDLRNGLLEIAMIDEDGTTTWGQIPDSEAVDVPTRQQVPGSATFARAEGLWHDDGTIYLATTADHRVHAYDLADERFEVIYDGSGREPGPLTHVDQMTATSAGEIFVCEDNEESEIDIGVMDRGGKVERFLSITGDQHIESEATGVIFNPAGDRMYFASQWAFGGPGKPGPGAIYEVTGPFRTAA